METREIVFLHKHLNVHLNEFAGTREYLSVACGPEYQLAVDYLFLQCSIPGPLQLPVRPPLSRGRHPVASACSPSECYAMFFGSSARRWRSSPHSLHRSCRTRLQIGRAHV